MQKKDDKVGNEAAHKEETQRKKGEQEKKKTTKKQVQILAFAHAWKTKKAA